MRKFVIISDSLEEVSNPFVVAVRDRMVNVASDIVYLIHTAELAYEMFPQFDFMDHRIQDNVYWFDDVSKVDEIIHEALSGLQYAVKVVMSIEEINFRDTVFYFVDRGAMYILSGETVYCADLTILSKLHRRKIDLEYVLEDNFKGYADLRVCIKELGMLDDIYSESNFLAHLRKYNKEPLLLFWYKLIWQNRVEIVYDIDCKYDNPYENILYVEDYLNRRPIVGIDEAKAEEYGMTFDSIPVRYEYSGFHTTTGRIYCQPHGQTALPSLTKAKRDVLIAEPGCYLVEIDFRSFEFDLLCQIVGIPVAEDPHTEMYKRIVGDDHPMCRDIGKKINYSFIYGMNANRLADSIINEVKDLADDFRDTFLENLNSDENVMAIREFEKRLVDSAKGNVIQNFFCRNIRFKKRHAILNNYISSTAADFFYIKFRQVVELLSGRDQIILENHDSILLQLSERTIASDTFDNILKIMEMPVSGLVGRINYKYGLNWRDLR